MKMDVIKRNGEKEAVDFNKIRERLAWLTNSQYVDLDEISKKVIAGLYDGVKTSQLDVLAMEVCAGMNMKHPDYGMLAGRISVSNIKKETYETFAEAVNNLGHILAQETIDIVNEDLDFYNNLIEDDNDYEFNIFAMETLKRSYLLKDTNNKVVETPQYMFLRVAVGINGRNKAKTEETYLAMSQKKYIHSSPTLFNAGTENGGLQACYLVKNKEDSVTGIYDTLKECALISKSAGGIGVNIHEVRASGSAIRGIPGLSSGIVPMLKLYNDTATWINQLGKRKGSIAIYLETHHADIMDFLQLRLPQGAEERRCRDLFTAVWASDYFMNCVKNDLDWHLFDPHTAPGLNKVHNDAYVELYNQYVEEKRYVKVIKAKDLWNALLTSITETGSPYVTNKDAANRLSNQQNLGTIESSNLCNEIIQYSSKDETACCNLASVSLPAFVNEDGTYDYKGLEDISSLAIYNLNKVIDKTYYPTPASRKSNMAHRPTGLGIQGLHDVFFKMRIPFDSEEAKEVNRKIARSLYYGAVRESIALAKKHGSYDSYKGSPAAEGKLQFDLHGFEDSYFDDLKEEMAKYGLRNSLLIALMPTASSATILGNVECFEALTSNVFNRKVLSGEFTVVNKYMMQDLCERNLEHLLPMIIKHQGSVQNVAGIPNDMKALYKTVWEISQRVVIDMASDRQKYVCQSQSMNLFMARPTHKKLNNMLMYAQSKGLKSLLYYLRSKPASEGIQFTNQETECEGCSA